MKFFAETKSSIRGKIRDKRKKLMDVLNSNYPNDDSKVKGHQRRIKNASIFYNELIALEREIFSEECCSLTIKRVNKQTFDKIVKEKKVFNIYPDGDFCKFAIIDENLLEKYVLIWISPISSL